MQGHWKGSSAGGCSGHPTHINNPKYNLTVHPSYANQCQVLVKLQAPRYDQKFHNLFYHLSFYRHYSVGINCNGKDSNFRASSEPYRCDLLIVVWLSIYLAVGLVLSYWSYQTFPEVLTQYLQVLINPVKKDLIF